MAKATPKMREEARRLFLTGALETNVEIAAHLRVKPHTVGTWRRQEDWDGLRRKIDRRAAAMFVEKIATDRVTLNEQHFKMWGIVLSRLLESMQAGTEERAVKVLERTAAVIERSQKGQRLARGLALDGQTEEQIRAEMHSETRHMVDVFLDVVKANVKDEETRERIARAILEAVPEETDGDGTDPGDDEVAH
jgi:hypothetical protein